MVGTIQETFEKYPEIGTLLPAMGYGEQQIKDLEVTINQSDADLVIIGTPIDLRKIITLNKTALRVYYELQEIGKPDLRDALKKYM
jgi:predicted GTPase